MYMYNLKNLLFPYAWIINLLFNETQWEGIT